MSKPCSKCKGEMSPGIHEPFHGEEAGLRLTIREMPYVACAQGHKRFASIAFAAELLDLMRSHLSEVERAFKLSGYVEMTIAVGTALAGSPPRTDPSVRC